MAIGMILGFAWLTPLIWNGLSKELPPGTPSLAAPFYRTSGMFEQSPENIRTYYVYVRTGDGAWKEIQDDLLTDYPLMGRRSRLQLILGSLRRPEDQAERQRFAEWVADTLDKRQLVQSSVESVRFLVNTRSTLQHSIEGAWEKPSSPGLNENADALLSEHRIQKK